MYKYIYIYMYTYIYIYIYIIHIIIIYYVEAPAGSLRRWPGTGPAYYRCIYIYIYIYMYGRPASQDLPLCFHGMMIVSLSSVFLGCCYMYTICATFAHRRPLAAGRKG